MTIAENIEARKSADALLALAEEFKEADLPRFWELVRDGAASHLPPPMTPKEIEPMSDLQAGNFGLKAMPFGKHAGRAISNVPLEYLAWFADQRDEFKNDVRRYLRSKYVQNETPIGDDDDE